MQTNQCIGCKAFPCADVNHDAYIVPEVDLNPADISVVLISEAAPPQRDDYYYAAGQPSFQQTTVQAFRDAGIQVASIHEILNRGVYLTTAVKCGKTGYGLQAGTIKECSHILGHEIDLFPNVRVYLLMGDVAIKALNYISLRAGAGRVVPAGSTYKLRGSEYRFRDARAIPSYLQVGPSFGIEKIKRRVIAEDIATAMSLAK